MIADYATTGLTVHRHPLRLLRAGSEGARDGDERGPRATCPTARRCGIGGLVVARQRPGTAKGVVFLLLEDETGTVNLIVPPRVYERDRLTVRTEPLVLAEGTLERHAAAGGAINVLVRRLVPARRRRPADRASRREVKDFSPLDERERRRILEEQPLVAVGGGGAESRRRSRAAAADRWARGGRASGVAAADAGRRRRRPTSAAVVHGAVSAPRSAGRAGRGAGARRSAARGGPGRPPRPERRSRRRPGRRARPPDDADPRGRRGDPRRAAARCASTAAPRTSARWRRRS